MAFSEISALPFCLLLLAVFTTQQFRCWPSHVPITEREGGVFRHYCFGCARRYLLCATAYFLVNVAFYLILLGAAWSFGFAGASLPWLLLVLAVVLPDLPGLNRPRNALRYQLQRYVFSPALPSQTEAELWRTLCGDHRVVGAPFSSPESSLSSSERPRDAPDDLSIQSIQSATSTAQLERSWEKLFALSGQLQHIVQNNPGHARHAELAELADFVREKTVALRRHGVRDTESLELLLGCCYLAIARLVIQEFHSETARRARLWELGVPIP